MDLTERLWKLHSQRTAVTRGPQPPKLLQVIVITRRPSPDRDINLAPNLYVYELICLWTVRCFFLMLFHLLLKALRSKTAKILLLLQLSIIVHYLVTPSDVSPSLALCDLINPWMSAGFIKANRTLVLHWFKPSLEPGRERSADIRKSWAHTLTSVTVTQCNLSLLPVSLKFPWKWPELFVRAAAPEGTSHFSLQPTTNTYRR